MKMLLDVNVNVTIYRRQIRAKGKHPMSDETYTIGELCAEFDVTPRTLRFYEQRELLSPPRGPETAVHDARPRAVSG